MSKNSAVAVLLTVMALLGFPAVAQDVHLGVKSCGSSGCHGQVSAFGSKVLLNEYLTWQKYDKHSQSYSVLKGKRAQRIAANLGIDAAHESDTCLNCHTTNIPEAQRGPQFNIADGVSCEACHGAGSGPWMGLHIGGADHASNVKNGLVPLEDPATRAAVCLDCHLGDQDQFATHRIMGAGHPRISFELDSFTAFQPAHYVSDDDYSERKAVVDGVKTWAVGQALMVERRMDLLIDSKFAKTGLFPELAFFDCHACHQPMSSSQPDSSGSFATAWKSRPGTGLGPGVAKLNDANMLMLEVALGMADAGMAKDMAANIRALHKAVHTSRQATVAAAEKVRTAAKSAVSTLSAMTVDQAAMQAALQKLIDRSQGGYFADYTSAEQATMALGAMIEAMGAAGFMDTAAYDAANAKMEAVYGAVGNDERYVRSSFVSAVKGLASAL